MLPSSLGCRTPIPFARIIDTIVHGTAPTRPLVPAMDLSLFSPIHQRAVVKKKEIGFFRNLVGLKGPRVAEVMAEGERAVGLVDRAERPTHGL